MHPWGYDILSFLFLRFYSDFGLAVFSFLSYTAVIAGTFGLVRKIFNNANLSLTTSFIIASLSGLILQAVTTKNDIPVAAVVVVCFLAALNFYSTKKYSNFYIIVVALLFGLSVKAYFLGFLVPFLFFYALLLIKEYRIKKMLFTIRNIRPDKIGISLILNLATFLPYFQRLVAGRRFLSKISFLLPLGLIFCLMVFWNNNLNNYGSIWGERAGVEQHINQDGLAGGAINAGRYVLQAIDLPEELGGNLLTGFHDKMLGNHNSTGALYPVNLSGKPFPDEDFSWYGLLGILIIPAVIYSSIKGKGFIRVISLSLLCYFLILSYTVAWMPWNSRFFALFFGGSGVCIAFTWQSLSRAPPKAGRQPYAIAKTSQTIARQLKNIILFLALLTMLYASLFNIKKPFINIYELGYLIKEKLGITGHFEGKQAGFVYPGPVIFTWVHFVLNRDAYYDMHYHSDVVKRFTNLVEPGKRLLFLAAEDSWNWVFPFLIKRPDLEVIVARPDHILIDGKIYSINTKDDLVFLKKRFDYLLCSEVKLGVHKELVIPGARLAESDGASEPARPPVWRTGQSKDSAMAGGESPVKKEDRIFCSDIDVVKRGPVCLYRF